MKGNILSLIFCAMLASVAHGDTVVSNGTLLDMTSTSLVSGNVNINAGGGLKLDFPSGTYLSIVLSNNIANNGAIGDFSSLVGSVLSGVISGTGGYWKEGIGTTIFTGSNTYTGGTYVHEGLLQAGGANVFSPGSSIFIRSMAVLDMNNYQQSVGSIFGDSNSYLYIGYSLPPQSSLVRLGQGKLATGSNCYISSASASTSNSTTVNNTTIYSGGTLNMGVAGNASSGLVLLAGNNTYTGATTISGGSLLALSSNELGLGSGTVGTQNTYTSSNYDTGATLTVAGYNNYSGLTKINAGTLTIGTTSLGTSVSTGELYGGTLTISGSLADPVTFQNSYSSGVVLGNYASLTLPFNAYLSSGLIFTGTNNTITTNSGTLTLTGTGSIGNTYNISESTNGSIVNWTGTNVTIPSVGLSLSNNHTITWAIDTTNNTITFSGTGGVLATASLSGSTFSVTVGGTTSGSFTTCAQPGVTTFDLPSGNGLLITGNDNKSGVFAGSISGNSGIVKVGTGVWMLTGTNTYTGLTTVANGALAVNGSIAGDVFVWGGVLGGSGFIGGGVLNQSVVSPGNSPGTLTIAGDYSQSAAGLLYIQIASNTVYDRLLIGGAADLNGAVLVDYYNGFKPKRGEIYTFLDAAGGVYGRFSSLIIPTVTMLRLQLYYQGDTVSLIPLQASFAGLSGLTPNQRAVAEALDKVAFKRSATTLIDKMDSLYIGQIPGALDKIAPTDLLSIFDTSIASANVQADNLERRMEEIRNGSVGFSDSGLHLFNSHGDQAASGDPKKVIDKDGKETSPAPLSEKWGFFINGSGEFVDVDSTSIARGYDFTTTGISVGADYRLNPNAAVGLTAGYANTSSGGYKDDTVKANGGKLGLYGTLYDKGLFLNGALGVGFNGYDTERKTLGGTAIGDTEGTNFNALLGTGFTYCAGLLSTGPVGSVRYTWVGVDGFTEHGSVSPLHFDDQSEESLKSTLGWQISYALSILNIPMKPEVRAQWQHDYLDSSRSIGASFIPGGAFNVYGPSQGHDSLLVDAGFSVRLNPQLGLYVFYTGDLLRQNYSSHSVNGGVQWSF